jgi:Leucine-rich repeat (LRR) protein
MNPFGQFDYVTSIYIDNNRIEYLSFLNKFKNLRILHASNNIYYIFL